MVGAKEQPAFVEPGGQGLEIVAPPLNLYVIAVRNVIDTHVEFGAAGQTAGGFLAEEEIGPRTECFGGVDGVVIGNGHEIHPQALQFIIYSQWLVVAFPAHAPQNRNRAHSRVSGVDVQVAPHTSSCKGLTATVP